MIHEAPAGARRTPAGEDAALPGDSAFDAPGEADATLFHLLLPLARRWRTLFAVPVLFMLAATTYRFAHGTWYTARTSFTPEAAGFSLASNLGALASIAGRFGIGAMAGTGATSPEFYSQIISSRSVLESVLETPFRTTTAAEPRALIDLADVSGDTGPERKEEALRWLAKHVRTDVDDVTGVVAVRVTMREPQLAADVANRIVTLVNDFNLQRRQSQSREERKFTGDRLHEAEVALRDAEAAHRRFLEANRVATSPLLSFEEARLRREVDLRQEIYEALSRKFEEARISEVQDTPVITVVDPATAPVKKSSPGLALLAPLALLLGLAAGVVVVYLQEFWSVTKATNEAEYLAFRTAVRRLRLDVRQPWKRHAG
jgi:uncharacterized protein involved in exopolysaccharide biosynthesis